jgi:hypothetical protein
MKKQYSDFESAREFVRKIGLENQRKWGYYCQSGKKPDDIPASPQGTYKNDFKGFGDFLGTGTVAPEDKVFCSFTEAREFTRSLNLKGRTEWEYYSKSDNKPDYIPANPSGAYKNKGWTNWGDFLGTGTVATQDKIYRPFEEARDFVRSLKLKSNKEWINYSKSGNKPYNIPQKPSRTYKNEFKGIGDWLGTGRIADNYKIYRPFEEAREFVRSLGLKNRTAWREYIKSGEKPDDIPSNPWNTYKERKKK